MASRHRRATATAAAAAAAIALIDSARADALDLAVMRLAASGLPPESMETLGLAALTATEVQMLGAQFLPLPALKLPYYDPWTGSPMSALPAWPDFYRLRYLAADTSFGGLAARKPRRYDQPADTGVCAYFAPGADWPKILKDHRHRLLITEGEIKAASACHRGLPTIGLGGVYNFRSARLALPILPALETVVWARREVYIVYDSDFKSNEDVCAALNALAELLATRGAIPYAVALPDVVEGGKTGLDDWLLTAQDNGQIESLLRDRAMPLTLARALWSLNETVIYVQDPGLIIVRETGQKLTPAAFKDHAFASLDHAEQVVRADGSLSLKPVAAAASWLRWPLRAEAGSLAYAPGQPALIPAPFGGSSRRTAYNVWPGWGTVPMTGEVGPFLNLLDHLFTGAPVADLDWFLRWLAYPVQHPGTKLFTSVLLYGLRHGTGKSLVGYTMEKIYGQNFTAIDQDKLHKDFNRWAENRQFVLGDDITGSDRREVMDKLKKFITQEKMWINVKFLPEYELVDCINYLFTSNQPDVFFLEDDDRRHFIHEVRVGPLDEQFYLDYRAWLTTGGAAALHDYLLKLDLSGFNPAAPARRTGSRDRMVADTRTDVASWVRALLTNPDAVLQLGNAPLRGDLFSNRALLSIYDPEGRTKTTANALGRELRRAGARQVANGDPLPAPQGHDRYYAVRNIAEWDEATAKVCLAHLREAAGPAPKKTKKF